MSVSSLIKKQHFEHFHLMMNGAAPLAESDVNRMFDKFGLDPDRLKFRQGECLREILDLRKEKKKKKKKKKKTNKRRKKTEMRVYGSNFGIAFRNACEF